jgi:hypothetical protein
MDDCQRQDLAPLVGRAAMVSSALARAAGALARQGDATLLERGLDRCAPEEDDTATCDWVEYDPACARGGSSCCVEAAGYCGSPWLPIAREKLTGPYVATILGCRAGGRGPPCLWGAAALGLLLLALRRRRRRLLAGLLLCAVVPAPARAAGEGFLSLEGHLSVLSDAPERSMIDVTLGYALRGGYRRGHWGALLHVERNYWLPTELSHALEPGALNLGAGAEYLMMDGRVRIALTAGPSILWFDTALDGKGTVGVFLDARPAGLRWKVGHHLVVVLDPLTAAVVAPVLGHPGIRQIEFRTLIGLEAIP